MALWTPANLSSVTLEGWYRVHDPAAILADGSDISTTGSPNTWSDQSSHGRTLTKEGSPGYNANGLSTGHPAVTFAFAGFRTAAGAGYPTSAVIGSMVIGSINGDGRISSLNASGSQDFSASGFIPMFKTSGNLKYWYNGATAATPHTNSTTVAIFEAVPLSATTADVGINTVLSGTPVTLTGVTIDRMGLFAESDNGTVATAGSCAEYILWAGVVSLSERQKLEGYIAWNNGQQALLPGGHPYASAAPTTGGGTTYTLTAAQGTFSLNGIAAAPNSARSLTAVKGAYVVNGIAAAFNRGIRMPAAQGAFIVSGIATTLNRGISMSAAQGSYTVNGIAAGLSRGRTVTAAQGSFTVNGIAASFPVALSIKPVTGVYTINGVATVLAYSPAGGGGGTLPHSLPFFVTVGPLMTK